MPRGKGQEKKVNLNDIWSSTKIPTSFYFSLLFFKIKRRELLSDILIILMPTF